MRQGVRRRVHSHHRMGPGVREVIRDQVVMMAYNDKPVKITEAEEAREEKSAAPEGIRDPVIQIIVIPRRRVVSDYGRAFVIVVVVYHPRIRLGLILGVLPGTPGYNGQTELNSKVLKS